MIRHYEVIGSSPPPIAETATTATIPPPTSTGSASSAGPATSASRSTKSATCSACGAIRSAQAPTLKALTLDHIAELDRKIRSLTRCAPSPIWPTLATATIARTAPIIESLETGNDLPDLKVHPDIHANLWHQRTVTRPRCAKPIRGERIGFARQRLEVAMCCTMGNDADGRRPTCVHPSIAHLTTSLPLKVADKNDKAGSQEAEVCFGGRRGRFGAPGACMPPDRAPRN